MNRVQLVRYGLWAAVAVVLVVAAVLTWNRLAPGAGDDAAATAAGPTAGLSTPVAGDAGVTIGGPFVLVNDEGATVTEAALEGHPTMIFFGFTYCPDVCPTALAEATAWINALGDAADQLSVYFVTVDPERDTQEQMHNYLGAFHPAIVGLTGEPEAVRAMLDSYRVVYRRVDLDNGDYTMNHTASFYLLDRQADLVGAIDYNASDDEALTKLRRLIGSA